MDDTAKPNQRVASEIRAWIGRRQTTGRKIAAKIGKSQTWVSTRTRGETPITIDDLHLFAEALEVEVASLLPTPARTADQRDRTREISWSSGTHRDSPVAVHMVGGAAHPVGLPHQDLHHPDRADRHARPIPGARTRRPIWRHGVVTS